MPVNNVNSTPPPAPAPPPKAPEPPPKAAEPPPKAPEPPPRAESVNTNKGAQVDLTA